MTTTYRLALGQDDFKKVYSTLKKWKVPNYQRSFVTPTCIAERDGKIVGVVTTGDPAERHAVVCDRVALDPKLDRQARMWTALRIVEMYDQVMKGLGMRWYHIPVDTKNQKGVDFIRRILGIEPYNVGETTTWFKRELA